MPNDGSGAGEERPAEDLEAADDDLRASLAGLAHLPSARLPLVKLLTRVAGVAVHAIPDADGAGLTLLAEGRNKTSVTTIGECLASRRP